jgi:hypothetical protein
MNMFNSKVKNKNKKIKVYSFSSEYYKRLGFDNASFDANKRLKQDFASSEEHFFSGSFSFFLLLYSYMM